MLLVFSVSLFAEDQNPGGTPPNCNPGYEAVYDSSRKFVCVPYSGEMGMPVRIGPSCHSDSDCPAGGTCVSCSSLKYISEAQCPAREAVCTPAKTTCPAGYTQTTQGCVRSDLLESHDVGFPAGPPQPNELCQKDSDCPNGAICVSCKTVLDYLSPVQCPPDKFFCEMPPKSQ